MKRTRWMLSVLSITILLLTGGNAAALSAAQSAPSPALIVSATLYLTVSHASAPGAEVTVHRSQAAWNETEVTWNNFGGQYDPSPSATFVASEGTIAVDVTALVSGWLSGAFPNYGLVLVQTGSGLTTYWSSDNPWHPTLRPRLEVCVSSSSDCFSIQRPSANVQDATIWGLNPDTNYGTESVLYSGISTGYSKQILLWFELPTTPRGSLGDRVWNDVDGDGNQDEGEPGIPGVQVRLWDSSGQILAETTTGEDGFYQFTGLLASTYTVCVIPETLPGSWVQTYDLDGILDHCATVALASGASRNDVDFGYWQPAPGCSLTPGYWKTHSRYGPAPLDDVWKLVGEDRPFFDTGQTWYEVLWTQPKRGNAYYILAHQYIAAFLNRMNGADVTVIGTAMLHASALLNQYDTAMNMITGAVRDDFVNTAMILDQYNNGEIGPGHCTD